MNERMCVTVNMRSHPVETPQNWIQMLIIIADKSTEMEHVITAPCTLQLPHKQPAYRLSACSSFTRFWASDSCHLCKNECIR